MLIYIAAIVVWIEGRISVKRYEFYRTAIRENSTSNPTFAEALHLAYAHQSDTDEHDVGLRTSSHH